MCCCITWVSGNGLFLSHICACLKQTGLEECLLPQRIEWVGPHFFFKIYGQVENKDVSEAFKLFKGVLRSLKVPH